MVRRLLLFLALTVGSAACATTTGGKFGHLDLVPGQAYMFIYGCVSQLGCIGERVVVLRIDNGWVLTSDGRAINLANVLAVSDAPPEIPVEGPILKVSK